MNWMIRYLVVKGDTAILQVKGRYNFAHISAIEKDIEFVTSVYHPKKILVDFSETEILTVAAWRSLKRIREIFGEENFLCIHVNEQIRYLLSIVNSEDWVKETKERIKDGKETGECGLGSDEGTFSKRSFDNRGSI